MVTCDHTSCGREKKIWLPTNDILKSEAVLHPWCLTCGLVKNISDDRPRKMGYWMNILSKFAHRFSLTQSQKRLIVKELEKAVCFDDLYGITGSAQKEIFIKSVEKYCGLCQNTIVSFVY